MGGRSRKRGSACLAPAVNSLVHGLARSVPLREGASRTKWLDGSYVFHLGFPDGWMVDAQVAVEAGVKIVRMRVYQRRPGDGIRCDTPASYEAPLGGFSARRAVEALTTAWTVAGVMGC